MAYHIYRQPKGVYKKFSGYVTAREFFESMIRVYEDPDFERFVFSINDFSEITGFSVGEKDMRTFAAHRLGAAFTAKIFVAIVTDDPKLASSISSYQLMTRSSNTPTEIFPTLEQALIWLKEKTGQVITLSQQH
jgi:hypothetical protein